MKINNFCDTAAYLISGAALGVVAVYLIDPRTKQMMWSSRENFIQAERFKAALEDMGTLSRELEEKINSHLTEGSDAKMDLANIARRMKRVVDQCGL